MNAERIRHLLFFEVKRLKWLIAMAWVSLLIAFVPGLFGAVGLWNSEWQDRESAMPGGGMLVFAVAGLFIATWAGLFGIRLIPTRPIRNGETFAVRVAVLLGVLVIPVLMLTLVSLWLHGFRGGLMWKNLAAVGLAIVPLWISLGFFARLAGSLRVMIAGLAILGVIFAVGDASPLRGMWAPWLNVVGSWLMVPVLVVTWVTAGLLILATILVKNRATATRMTVAVFCVVLGSGTMIWSYGIWSRSKAYPRVELSKPIRWTGEGLILETREGPQVDFMLDDGSRPANQFVKLRVLGELEGKNGVRLISHANPGDPYLRVGGGMTLQREIRPGQRILEDGVLYSSEQRSSQWIIDRQLDPPPRLSCLLLDGAVPDKFEGVSGRLVGEVYEVEKVVEAPFQKGVHFRETDFMGEIEWISSRNKLDKPSIGIRMKSLILNQDGNYYVGPSAMWNWIFHLRYPKSGVVIEGTVEYFTVGNRVNWQIGGVQGWNWTVSFESSRVSGRKEMWEEDPLLQVYRVKPVETGYCDVTLPEIQMQDSEPGSIYYAEPMGGNPRQFPLPSSDLWKERPDPLSAKRAEVGAWIRAVKHTSDYGGMDRDLAEFAGGWGDLLIEIDVAWDRYRNSGWPEQAAFVDGGDDMWRDHLMAALGEVYWAPGAVVGRGWLESSREKVTELIMQGRREEEVLKLGVLLKIEGVKEAILEKLESSDDSDLYEIARTIPTSQIELDEALDRRLERLDKQSRMGLSYMREDGEFELWPWISLLSQGREKDLERLLDWIQRCLEVGKPLQEIAAFSEIVVCELDFNELSEAKKLEAGFFLWDPVLRQWNFNGKGKSE